METVKFYFSFRSPYAWLAFHRVQPAFAGLPVQVRRIPVFPPKDFPNDPAALPSKAAYIGEDVARIAGAYGLRVTRPKSLDTDWMRPHAAYLHAEDNGRGIAFGGAVYAARFSDGQDVGDDDVLRRVARSCDLDPDAVLHACDDPALHERVMQGITEGLQDGIFGVPFFIYRKQKFWGNDRLEWLLRAIAQDAGRAAPDLKADLLQSPYGKPA